MLGIGISALPSDLALFNVDAATGQNRRMTLESLDIMLRLWTEGPMKYDGELWSVRPPETQFDFLSLHLRPFQKPHPPIGIAGLSPGSETLKIAGERGFMPLSVSLNLTHTASHWSSVEAGAARSGRTPDRRDWRLVKEVYVARTDDKERRFESEGAGLCWREYLLPFYLGSGMHSSFKVDPSHADSSLDVDYLIERSWFVGSAQTVIDKIGAHQQRTGGFGGLLAMVYDMSGEAERWTESLELLTREVMPHFPEEREPG